jgi:hypothetical protein
VSGFKTEAGKLEREIRDKIIFKLIGVFCFGYVCADGERRQ